MRGASVVDLSDFLSYSLSTRPSQHFYLVFGGQLELRPFFGGNIEYSDKATPGDIVLVGLDQKRQRSYLALKHPSDGDLYGLSFDDPDDFCYINAHHKDYLVIVKEWDLAIRNGEQEIVIAERRFPPGLPIT